MHKCQFVSYSVIDEVIRLLWAWSQIKNKIINMFLFGIEVLKQIGLVTITINLTNLLAFTVAYV